MVQRAVLETRAAVRRALAAWSTALATGATARSERAAAGEGAGSAPLVLVALSGGADSLALAAATAYEAERAGLRAGAVVVDHALQQGSALVAARAAEQAERLGLAPVIVDRVRVGEGRGDGPEAAARAARYAAFARAAERSGAAAILTAHTRDDQSEQVLLALARGSGLRSLAGIPPRRELAFNGGPAAGGGAPGREARDGRSDGGGRPGEIDSSQDPGVAILRPFLTAPPEITRATTEAACAEAGLEPWRDPHNRDAAFSRVRVRERVLPALVRELGPGVPAALARSADLAREDADALDAIAEGIAAGALAGISDEGEGAAGTPAVADRASPPRVGVAVEALAGLPAALLGRVIRVIAARRFGAHLSREHTSAIAALVTDWRGQGPVYVPGVRVSRAAGRLEFSHQTGSPRAPR